MLGLRKQATNKRLKPLPVSILPAGQTLNWVQAHPRAPGPSSRSSLQAGLGLWDQRCCWGPPPHLTQGLLTPPFLVSSTLSWVSFPCWEWIASKFRPQCCGRVGASPDGAALSLDFSWGGSQKSGFRLASEVLELRPGQPVLTPLKQTPKSGSVWPWPVSSDL